MKERPILFSAPMVRAILEGRKTQTRRAVKLPERSSLRGTWEPTTIGGEDGNNIIHDDQVAIWNAGTGDVICCPYGIPGDRMWVRETWQGPLLDEDYDHPEDDDIYTPKYCVYRADGGPVPEFVTCDDKERSGWRPSIHMPRWASRIMLEVVSVRVERLQDISEADAKAEGVIWHEDGQFWQPSEDINCPCCFAYGAYAELWQSINGPESWDANPWVWVVEFRRGQP